MEISYPEITSKDESGKSTFNMSWFTSIDKVSLTLSMAKKYFVSLTGYNIIHAYMYLKNALYSVSSISCTYLSSQTIATQKIVCDKLICNEIEISKKNIIKPSYISFFGMTLPLEFGTTNRQYCENLYIDLHVKLMIAPKTCINVLNDRNKSVYAKRNDSDKYYFKEIVLKEFTNIKLKSLI